MSEAAETRESIMEATFEALAKHGYAGLTIQTIADEFEKSKSLLYYHYDTKEDLLADFLRWMTDGFVAEVEPVTDGDVEARLDTTLDLLLPRDLDTEGRAIRTALLELRMQAPHHEAYADRFAALDAQLESTLEATLRRGVEEGIYDVDPARGARLLTATANGELLRVVTGETDAADARAVLDALLERFRT
ncbi:TetR/AcrR family transcriptional regulator [Salinirubellus salinus]|jgi:AcrR family transcriptional regulator|uniref:TetR/AcrR family transcriptional regulator n=1 Tax=Salinirubellus salinus TaxID=1364945 RepID=A0A9E7R203_9EURY|nr:TetR/AcrR family transcriptional regulator [Salinirubellus salinus]UWM54028.1 TetR/AcrR family transcriptional regulator [Salinirubellus salinus]